MDLGYWGMSGTGAVGGIFGVGLVGVKGCATYAGGLCT